MRDVLGSSCMSVTAFTNKKMYRNLTSLYICKKNIMNGSLSLQTDAFSSQKSSANLFQSEERKHTKLISMDDDAGVSTVPATDDPTSCNLVLSSPNICPILKF